MMLEGQPKMNALLQFFTMMKLNNYCKEQKKALSSMFTLFLSH